MLSELFFWEMGEMGEGAGGCSGSGGETAWVDTNATERLESVREEEREGGWEKRSLYL